MADPKDPDPASPPVFDPEAFSGTMAEIARKSQALVAEFLARQGSDPTAGLEDPMHIGQAFLDMTSHMMTNPGKVMEANLTLWLDYMTLWQNATLKALGGDPAPVAEPERGDRRFRDDAWKDEEVFDFIKQSYLLAARWVRGLVHDVEGLDRHTQEKVEFYTRQVVDALAPTNFLLTNPEVLRETMESSGENLLNGLKNLLTDLERGKGTLRISMTDEAAFEVGVNVASTPGAVVFRNALMELLQYTPSTETVQRRPLLIIPPWINKFYILDLRPKNSFIKWAVDQGHSVFVVSWVNPDSSLAHKTFDDYMLEGPLAALDEIRAITGEDSVNAIGYCLGGTLLGCLLSWLAAKGEADRIASATHFTTLLDFEQPGELGVFIDEDSLRTLEAQMAEQGYLDGKDMANTFNLLRDNDLIWSFVVNNYLMGKAPLPFDLLYWNADSTRMPAPMHSFYLRNMYLENRLREPGGLTLAGEAIDLRRVKTPSYFVSCREDHIAPWKSTFAGSRLYAGPVRFVLSASGHIAGIVNPPVAQKYCFWTNTRKTTDPDAWLDKATRTEGSWWTDWQEWVSKHGNGEVPARLPGADGRPLLGEAPGSYVKVRA